MQILGSKKGASQPQKPHIAKDDLSSTSYYKGLYGLCEGEIEGLADGGKSIKLDGTPLINANGQPNFKGVTWDFRAGTLDQTHISGFPAVENEQNIGVELRHDRPYTKAINNKELSAVRVRLNLNALREQKDNGDIVGYAIEYAIDLQTDTGAFVEVLRQPIRGKASNGFKRSHRIDLPPSKKGWTIRIRRITPNRDSDLVADTMTVDAITEIIDAKLAYPCTALLGLSYDAKTFSNIAKVAVRLKGKIIQVPTNYNPQTRQYTGLWDGTFKMAYSNNPAWVFYDLCTHKRYGLGERLNGMVDKWRLYQIGQYCDEMVDDGKGGKEPRFTINVYIQKAEDAYKVLQNLASVFRGMSFWDGQNIVVDSDTPKDPVYTFSPANIVGGEFTYQGTRDKDRHTVAKVAWDNSENDFKTEYEPVTDEESLATYGLKQLDINAFGCTSLGQAQRAGLWALKSEQLETRSVTFKTGLQGFIPQVGQVINIADNVFAGRAISGRIVNVNGKQITLDRTAGKVGDTLTVATADGVLSAKITAINGETLTLQQALNVENQSVWAIVADDLKLMQFRVLTIEQHDNATFSITALQYEPQKFDVVDNGVHITPQPYSVLKATPITAPNSVTLTASSRTVQGQAVTTLTINWEQVQGATAYLVKWRKDDGNWQTLPKISGQSVDIDGIYAGKYLAQVQAVDSFDNESLPATSVLTTINGKVGKPPHLAKFAVKGILFGMQMDWAFARGSDDTNFTEIQVSPDGRSNIASLGTFSYPTNSHTINGLQGNLIQFYRARIVDKLGNTSDWTAWTKGVTDSSADKVLDLLNGQIAQSQLHQDLVTPIAKIPTLETGITAINGKLPTLENSINAINGQLPTLNGQIATLSGKATTLQNELNTAKNTLQTAVANITTERNRINTTIRDITALQTANNAKTQEIANLTQTVNGHTSSIRDLAVTTGDLSQKYTALKTATDTANSEITAIKQTQNGQATSIERLGARFDNLGNLLHQNALTVGQFWHHTKNRAEIANTHSLSDFIPTIPNVRYIIRANTGVVVDIRLAWFDSSQNFVSSRYEHNNMPSYEFVATGEFLRISYNHTRGTDFELMQMAHHQITANTNAKLDEFKQSQADKDLAISQRIDSINTAYKTADNQTTAKLGQIEQSISDKDRAMSQRVDTLNADFTTLDNRTKWTELTTATDLNTLTETGKYFIRASSNPNAPFAQYAYVVVEKARADRITQTAWADNNASLVFIRVYNGAWQAWEKTATGKELREKASTASLNEFKQAQATKDTAMAERIANLDTAYKNADSQLSGRITTAQQTATNAQNAVASVQSELTAKFNSLAVGGRNLLKNSQAERTVSNATTRELFIPYYVLTKPLEPNTAYVLSFEYKTTDNAKTAQVGFVSPVGQHKFKIDLTKTTDWQKGLFKFTTGNNTNQAGHIRFDNEGTTNGQSASLWIKNVKLELGNIPSDYTQAPEDLQTAIDEKASSATLNEFKQTSANADTALGQRITAIDTAYKQADTATNAKLANAEKAISDNNTALSQRITALDTAYKSADNNLASRLAREETARANGDNANSQAIRTLESTVNGIGGRVGTSESKIATLERTTSDTNQALATAQSQLNVRFDNLSVGGRNYFKKSSVVANLRNTATATKTADNGIIINATNANPSLTRINRVIDEVADWTVSFEAKANTPCSLFVDICDQNRTTHQLTTEFKKYITTGRPARIDNTYHFVDIETQAVATIEIKNIKIEKGNIATDWTPAPEDLQIEINSTNAKLDEFKQTFSNHNVATASRIDTLTANLITLNNQSTWQVINNTTDLNSLTETGKYFIQNTNNPNSPSPPHWLFVEVDKGTNERIKQIATQDNDVKNQWVRHCLHGHWGEWEKVATSSELRQKADATALNSLTTKVNQVDGKITAEANKITTLQTTVNGQTASIQQQATSIDGLKAQYTVKIDSGGRVSGFGLASGGGVSDFSVRADKFLIAPPSGNGKGDSPFMVLTTPTNINGTVVPSGTYIKSAYIANGSIDNLQVKDGAITTAKIAEASITTAKIMDLAVDTIKIQDRAVTVPHTFTDTNPRNFENKRFDSFEKSETGRTVPEISEWVLHGLTPNTEIMVIVDVGRLSMFIRRPDNIAYSKDYDCAVRLGVGYMTALRPDDWDILNHSQALPTLIAHPHQGYPMPIASSTTATQLSGAFFRRLTVPEDGTVDLNLWCATYGSVDDRTIITAKTDKVTWYVLELKK